MLKLSTSRLVLVATLALGAWGCSDDDEPAGPTGGTTGTDGSASDAVPATDAVASDANVADTAAADAAAADAASGDAAEGDGGVVLNDLQKRGQYLVDHVIACPDCHTPQKMDGSPDFSKYMAGGFCFIPGPGGTCLIASRNLTNHETGLKNRTDAEIKSMFLDGKRPSATGDVPLFPIMPYYVFHNMKAEDADAIVAYLRTIPGVNNVVAPKDPSLNIPAPAAPLTLTKVPAVPADYTGDKVAAERGKYLASQIGLCVECHSKHLTPGPGVATVLDEDKLFQGGEDFTALFPPAFMWRVVSKNITSDVATGIGTRQVADIVKELKLGVKMDGKPICPPMPAGPRGAYGGLTDADATDIANYIHSLPAKTNDTGMNMCVPPMMPPPPADGGASDGAAGDTAISVDTAMTPADGASVD
jgi:cytochrome c553